MCRQRELMERSKILEESGTMSNRVSIFCMDAAEIILREKEDADGEKLSTPITHPAMTGDRMEKEDDREMEISPEVLEGVRREAVHPRALCVSQQTLRGTALKSAQTEADFLTVHLYNILMQLCNITRRENMMFNYLLAAGTGAMSSILANKNVAVYNDRLRPVYTGYFSRRMDRKLLVVTSFAMSSGLIIGFGFTNSIAMGIIIIHTFLLMEDIIGTWCSDTLRRTILSGVIGAVRGIMVVVFMSSTVSFFPASPVNFPPYIGNAADIVVATFAVFPSLAVIYQHGIKKGGIITAITLAAYMLVKNLGVFNIGEFEFSSNADGMSILAGSIMTIVFAIRIKQEAIGAGLTNIFSDNVNHIKKDWTYFLIMGGLLSVAASQCVLTIDVISGLFQMKNEFAQTALVVCVCTIGYIPLVYTMAIVTGAFSPAGSCSSVAAGMLYAPFGLPMPAIYAVAFVSGAMAITAEAFFLGSVGNMLDKSPALRELGNHTRNAMSQVLEVALLVGGFTVSAAIMDKAEMPYIGSMTVMIVWMMNKHVKKPFPIPMAVGPVVIITTGFAANLIKILGLALI